MRRSQKRGARAAGGDGVHGKSLAGGFAPAAQPLAAALDAEKFKEVAGTIAGDDTVLVITPSKQARIAVQKRMEDLLR